MDGSFDGTLGSDPVHQDRPHQWARLVDLTRFLVSKPKLLFAAQMAVAPTLPQHLKPCPMSDSQGGPADSSAGHGFITFGVFRYVLGHKALDPVAGIPAAVEKGRHRSTDVRSTARRATATSHATLRGRPNLARLRDRLVPRDYRVTLQKCHSDKRASSGSRRKAMRRGGSPSTSPSTRSC